MPHKVFDIPGALRTPESHFPHATEVFAEHRPGSVGHTALTQILRQPKFAAVFAACAWAYRDAATLTQRHESLGGMYAVCLQLVLDWRFPFPKHFLAQRAMQALYEASTGIESPLEEPAALIEEETGRPDFFN